MDNEQYIDRIVANHRNRSVDTPADAAPASDDENMFYFWMGQDIVSWQHKEGIGAVAGDTYMEETVRHIDYFNANSMYQGPTVFSEDPDFIRGVVAEVRDYRQSIGRDS